MVQQLVTLTHLETEFANLDFGRSQRRSGLSSLAFNAYIGLEKLCQPLHGDVKRSVLLLFKNLLPSVLMTHKGSSEISQRGLTVIREHSLHFVKRIVGLTGKNSDDAIQIFIQHLALQVPERAEYRSKASLAIIGLTNNLSGNIYEKVVRWLMSWAHSEKIPHRLFAVEVHPLIF